MLFSIKVNGYSFRTHVHPFLQTFGTRHTDRVTVHKFGPSLPSIKHTLAPQKQNHKFDTINPGPKEQSSIYIAKSS